MNEQDLTVEQEKEVDDFVEKAFLKGKEAFLEMGENYKRFLKIMAMDGVINPKEQIIIFGIFLLKTKVYSDGYKHISKNKFINFYQEFKNEIQKEERNR